jgi:hypothetical protein
MKGALGVSNRAYEPCLYHLHNSAQEHVRKWVLGGSFWPNGNELHKQRILPESQSLSLLFLYCKAWSLVNDSPLGTEVDYWVKCQPSNNPLVPPYISLTCTTPAIPFLSLWLSPDIYFNLVVTPTSHLCQLWCLTISTCLMGSYTLPACVALVNQAENLLFMWFRGSIEKRSQHRDTSK